MNVRLTSAGVDRVGTLVLGLQPKKNGKGNPNRRGYSASSLCPSSGLNRTNRLSSDGYISGLKEQTPIFISVSGSLTAVGTNTIIFLGKWLIVQKGESK